MIQRLLISFLLIPAFSFSQKTLIECLHYPLEAEFAKQLIEKGADINVKDKNGSKPIELAIRAKSFDVAKLIIEKGTDINEKSQDGKTPLMYALEQGDYDLVEYIINHGADVNVIDNINTHTTFYVYLFNTLPTKIKFIQLLEIKGVDLTKCKGLNNQSLLFVAAAGGDLETIKYLIEEKKMDINEVNNEGQDIIESHINVKAEVLIYLLSKFKSARDYNRYFIAAGQSNNVEFAKYLIENYKIDVNSKDSFGKTVLMNLYADYNFFMLLLKKGININAQDSSGRTALMYAVGNYPIERIILLVENGANVNLHDNDNWTVLDYAENYRIFPVLTTEYNETFEAMILYLKKKCHAKNGKNKKARPPVVYD
ncbi:MAG: ankyrin repeat domain-containing protein [Bacteroidia bacterium]